MNGLIGRGVVVVVVVFELGSDIYLCSDFRMNWAHRAEARGKEFCFETQKDFISNSCACDEGVTFRVYGGAGLKISEM